MTYLELDMTALSKKYMINSFEANSQNQVM